VALGELAIAAGLLGESVSIACDFPANTLCQVWKYYTHALGPGNTIHVRAKRDLKDLTQRITGVRAVFVYCPPWYQEVAWSIQMAGTEVMSPRPAVFCGFLHEDPDSDPGLSLPLTNDEREVAAVHRWAVSQAEQRAVEVEFPSSVEYDLRLEATLRSSAFGDAGLGFREQRIVEALLEAASFLRATANQERSELQVSLGDYGFVRGLLCSQVVRPNREFCEPLAADKMNRANVYLSVKVGSDRRNPFRVEDDDGYRQCQFSDGRNINRVSAKSREWLCPLCANGLLRSGTDSRKKMARFTGS
jgi:hypothetical protein